MISQLVSSSPTLGSVLTVQSLKPASHSVSPSLFPSPARALSLSLSRCRQGWPIPRKRMSPAQARRQVLERGDAAKTHGLRLSLPLLLLPAWDEDVMAGAAEAS